MLACLTIDCFYFTKGDKSVSNANFSLRRMFPLAEIQVQPEKVTASSHFVNDLGLDSLDAVEVRHARVYSR